jgi:hypothetical protein
LGKTAKTKAHKAPFERIGFVEQGGGHGIPRSTAKEKLRRTLSLALRTCEKRRQKHERQKNVCKESRRFKLIFLSVIFLSYIFLSMIGRAKNSAPPES